MHTAGPWDYVIDVGGVKITAPADETDKAFFGMKDIREVIATVHRSSNTKDARLIAAAPELLEALEMANELIPSEVRACYQVPMLKIKAAIAKAKGE